MKQSEKRFVTKKDSDGYWKVWDKQHKNFLKTGKFHSQKLAVGLAKVYEDHAASLARKAEKNSV